MSKLLTPENILNLLLVFVPIAIVLEYVVHARPTWIFVTSCLAIIPLAGLMGKATEHLAEKVGEGIGGLLNATFGNAAELIIAIMALRAGLYDVVKASITGSIIGNILLVFGLSALLGGARVHDPDVQQDGGEPGHDAADAGRDRARGAGDLPLRRGGGSPTVGRAGAEPRDRRRS